jgi:serine/threonine protein phosphatase 1
MHFVTGLFGPKGRVPEGQIVYAIGDIHGRNDLLGQLHSAIEGELASGAAGRQATIVYLGDYVDRGPDSKAVIERLLDRPVMGAESIFLKGNHEDAMLRFLAGQQGGEDWFAIGGGATAMSYGVQLRKGSNEALSPELARATLGAAVPPRHIAFLKNLKMFHQAGDYLFVHAGIRPGIALEDQHPQDLLWIRGEFLRSRRRHGYIVVHGHSSSSEVVVRRNRICVDTRAYATDRLSCLVLEGSGQRILRAAL